MRLWAHGGDRTQLMRCRPVSGRVSHSGGWCLVAVDIAIGIPILSSEATREVFFMPGTFSSGEAGGKD